MILTVIIKTLLVLAGTISTTAFLYFSSLLYKKYISSLSTDVTMPDLHISSHIKKQIEPSIHLKARILCNIFPPESKESFSISGFTDCYALNTLYKGNLICKDGCLGLFSCARICPNDAISITNSTIFITDSCTGCGLCISICPKKLIELIPANDHSVFTCSSGKKGVVQDDCNTAKNGYHIDPTKIEKSGFKIKSGWGILASNQRNS